jgi:hypothetical protein
MEEKEENHTHHTHLLHSGCVLLASCSCVLCVVVCPKNCMLSNIKTFMLPALHPQPLVCQGHNSPTPPTTTAWRTHP